MKTIMVCDDENDILTIYETILKRASYNVITVSSGKECLAKYEEWKRNGRSVDVLLVDYKLPDIFGDEVACKIKEMNGTKVLLISAYDVEQRVLEDLRARNCIIGKLRKPIAKDVLLKRLAGIIGSEQEEETILPHDREAYVADAILANLNKHLGEGTANLILKTLKLVYKIDESTIRAQPDILEEKLRKIIGDDAAQMIINDVSRSRSEK